MNERIKQNLIDAGCDSDFISRFEGCICDPKACERLLAEHRRELPDEVHAKEDNVSDTAAAEMRAVYKVGFKDEATMMKEIQD